MFFASFFRPFLREARLTLFALFATVPALFAQTPSAADGFDPNSDGNVYAVASQSDGKIVVGGQFTLFRNVGGFGYPRANLARFQADGSLDQSFDTKTNGLVRAVVVQADGKILIGGDFTTVQPAGAASPVTRNRIARLNTDGSVDTAFNPNIGGQLQPQVHAIMVQTDGRIVVGGTFTNLQPNGAAAATTRNYLARLNADGSVDAGFNPNPNSMVMALAQHVDGKILVGGGFVRFQENGKPEPTTRNRIARLNPDGTVDSEFDPNADNGVTSIVVQRDGKILIGGFFGSVMPLGYPPLSVGFDGYTKLTDLFKIIFPSEDIYSPAGQNTFNNWSVLVMKQFGVGRWEDLPVDFADRYNHGDTVPKPPRQVTPAVRQHVARLNANGSLDTDFVVNTSGNVLSLGLQPDGSVLVGGQFTTVWGRTVATTSRNYLARFNPDGSVDQGFNPGFNAAVSALAFQTDGRILVGGFFTHAQPPGVATALNRNRLARLNTDGSVDANFEIDAGGRILTEVVLPNGQILIGGSFTNVGGAQHNFFARLNADGSVDPTYTPDFNGRVLAAVLQPDGKAVVAGSFTTIGGERRLYIARLNPSGTIDSEFHPELDGQAGALALQSDGRILVAGSFNSIKGPSDAQPVRRPYILRLNTDGTLDTSFDPSPNNAVSVMRIQKDGKILVGGDFLAFTPGASTATTQPKSFLRYSVARLNADGTVDEAYDPSLSGQVTGIVIQSDGKAVMGGVFTSLQPKDITGRTEATRRFRIARFDADGKLDLTYDPKADAPVITLAIQPDDKVIVGGSFTTFTPNGASNWTLRRYVARLNTDGTVDSTFDLDLNERPGNRVDSINIQPDGKIYVGGSFTSLQPKGSASRVERKYLARINSNGTLDTGFDVRAGGATGGQVTALAVQRDDRVVAVGSFADLGGAKSSNVARFNPEGPPDPTFSSALTTDGTVNTVAIRPNGAIVRAHTRGFSWLDQAGTQRTAFNPGPVSPINGDVYAFAREADGSVIVGGSFTNVANPLTLNLARFLPNGTLDTSFTPSPNANINGIAVQKDGKIIIVGSFTAVNGVARNRVARLNRDGSVDASYDPNANSRVSTVILQEDGRALVGGNFSGFVPKGEVAAVSQPYIARLNTDGTLDRTYATIPNGPVTSITIQEDGKAIAGGQFTIVQSNKDTYIQTRNYIVRLNTDGTLDMNFDPNLNGPVNAVALGQNGQIVFGGAFTVVQPNGSTKGVTRNGIARVNFDGSLDTSFDPNANDAVTSITVQPDGGIVFSGSFTTVKPAGEPVAIARNRVARVTGTGKIDFSFNPDVNGSVFAVSALADGSVLLGGNFTGLQPVGSIMIGGAFASVGGVPARNLAILNDNGSVSASFQPRPDGTVNALLAQPDSRTVVGGAFTNIAGAPRNRVARISADGSLDATFNPNANGPVYSLALQADGKILIGGSYTSIGGQARNGLARFNADGSLDGSFASPGLLAGLAVRGLVVQADGRILMLADGSGSRSVISRLNADGSVDGTFAAVSSGSATFTSMALQTDGRIVVSGDFTSIAGNSIARLARLNPNGSVDPTFAPAPDGAVSALALQPDGRLVIGGRFTTVGGLNRVGLARLAPTSPAMQTLGVAPDRTRVFWNRSGTGGEMASVLFELSLDRQTWVTLGAGSRVAGTANWQLGGLSLPASGLFYIRARGIAVGTAGISSGFYELVRQFNFASPAPTTDLTTFEMNGGSSTASQGAGAAIVFVDPFTGIASRRTLAVVPNEGTVEIVAASPSDAASGMTARLVNLSTRGRITPGSPLVLGFAIVGSEPRSVLLRAVGPGLDAFGVENALRSTRLELYNAAGAVIGQNEGWANAPVLVDAAARTGAFPYRQGSADSALLVTLAPGNYSLRVVDARSNGGVGMAEIYDAGTGTASRLVNVSSLGDAGTGNNALISGFVITGGGSEKVLLRGVGPGLTAHGVESVVADPSIALFDASGQVLGGNDNWVSSVSTVSTAASASGAFSLTAGSKDAAVIATLPSGAYTIQVSGGSSGTGSALLEIYEVR
jgi:uncharacterized delta-60 repeat protein